MLGPAPRLSRFIQVGAFLSMNMPRHLRAHRPFDDLISGNDTKADATRQFYDEYFAVFDLPAEFYLETVQRVFQEHLLPAASGISRQAG